nr:unnamed protein product [Callosobruchus chinensis]
MAPALSTSQPTPSPKSASPVRPEKSSPSNATNATVIQHTSTLFSDLSSSSHSKDTIILINFRNIASMNKNY